MGPRVQAARRRASRMLSHKIAEERAKEERAGRKKALQTTSRVLVYKGRRCDRVRKQQPCMLRCVIWMIRGEISVKYRTVQ